MDKHQLAAGVAIGVFLGLFVIPRVRGKLGV